MTYLPYAGFPHSDISGSQLMCSSPKLFAAYHVFHRLSVPRHPPCALSCLTFYSLSFDLLGSQTTLLRKVVGNKLRLLRLIEIYSVIIQSNFFLCVVSEVSFLDAEL